MRNRSHVWDRLAIAIAVALSLSACNADKPVAANYSNVKPTIVAGADGWYRFRGFEFKGRVVDGRPVGQGICRTQYQKYGGMVEEPCEFTNGVRTDASFVASTSSQNAREIAAREKARQEAEARERARIAENNRRVEESERAFGNAYRQAMGNLQTYSSQLAEADRRTNQYVEDARMQIAASHSGTYIPPPRRYTPGERLYASSGDGGSKDEGKAGSSDSSSNTPEERKPAARRTKRGKFHHDGINDGGARAGTPALAEARDIEQLNRQADKWVGSTCVITNRKIRGACTTHKQYEGDYWSRCILDIDYECDVPAN